MRAVVTIVWGALALGLIAWCDTDVRRIIRRLDEREHHRP